MKLRILLEKLIKKLKNMKNNDKENIFNPLTKSEIISKDNNCFIF